MGNTMATTYSIKFSMSDIPIYKIQNSSMSWAVVICDLGIRLKATDDIYSPVRNKGRCNWNSVRKKLL